MDMECATHGQADVGIIQSTEIRIMLFDAQFLTVAHQIFTEPEHITQIIRERAEDLPISILVRSITLRQLPNIGIALARHTRTSRMAVGHPGRITPTPVHRPVKLRLGRCTDIVPAVKCQRITTIAGKIGRLGQLLQ